MRIADAEWMIPLDGSECPTCRERPSDGSPYWAPGEASHPHPANR